MQLGALNLQRTTLKAAHAGGDAMVKAPQFSILPYVGVLAFMQLPNQYLDPDGWRWEM